MSGPYHPNRDSDIPIVDLERGTPIQTQPQGYRHGDVTENETDRQGETRGRRRRVNLVSCVIWELTYFAVPYIGAVLVIFLFGSIATSTFTDKPAAFPRTLAVGLGSAVLSLLVTFLCGVWYLRIRRRWALAREQRVEEWGDVRDSRVGAGVVVGSGEEASRRVVGRALRRLGRSFRAPRFWVGSDSSRSGHEVPVFPPPGRFRSDTLLDPAPTPASFERAAQVHESYGNDADVSTHPRAQHAIKRQSPLAPPNNEVHRQREQTRAPVVADLRGRGTSNDKISRRAPYPSLPTKAQAPSQTQTQREHVPAGNARGGPHERPRDAGTTITDSSTVQHDKSLPPIPPPRPNRSWSPSMLFANDSNININITTPPSCDGENTTNTCQHFPTSENASGSENTRRGMRVPRDPQFSHGSAVPEPLRLPGDRDSDDFPPHSRIPSPTSDPPSSGPTPLFGSNPYESRNRHRHRLAHPLSTATGEIETPTPSRWMDTNRE
ncbi:hypothetical protein F5Y17DRAFT_473461 [Xylariaceae sp. FL0594]|nr:hypothetical protein F5Y17DRAFT_473461 [Xylariaceae sp. FL0594]